VLGVPLAAIRLHLDQRRAVPGPRPVDRLAAGLVALEHVVAVHLDPGAAVSPRPVDHVAVSHLPFGGGRVGVRVVLRHEDHRQPLGTDEVPPFVGGAGREAAVADIRHADTTLVPDPRRQRDATHDRDHVAEHRDGADEPFLEIAEVDVEVLPCRGSGPLRHVLLEDVDRFGSLDEDRAEVADQRGDEIPGLQGVRGPHGLGLLSQRPVDAADHFALAVQVDQPLLEPAVEHHPPVEIEQPLPVERKPVGDDDLRDGRR